MIMNDGMLDKFDFVNNCASFSQMVIFIRFILLQTPSEFIFLPRPLNKKNTKVLKLHNKC